jgi:hypothetical protein
MADKQVRKSPQRKGDDDISEAPDKKKKVKQENETSAITEDVLEDIDRVLKSVCGFDDDESISDDEFTERAEVFVRSYQQKGGQ